MTTLKAVSLVAVLFVGLAVGIFAAAYLGYITGQLALLLLVAMLGMYLGFGVLIAVYRFTSKLK
jgi:hypothetical protein